MAQGDMISLYETCKRIDQLQRIGVAQGSS